MNTVTGEATRSARHAARPGTPVRAVVIAVAAAALLAGAVAALVQHAGSVPSAPASAERITVAPRPTPTT